MLRSSLALAAVLLLPLAALAHGMGMDLKVSGSTVSMAVSYDDDTPAAGAKVKVLNAAKEVVLEGTTDDKGTWTFSAPPPGEYTVRVKTDDGHAAKRTFTIPEVPPPADAPVVERASVRPPRLLYLGAGVVGIALVFTLIFVFLRKRTPPR